MPFPSRKRRSKYPLGDHVKTKTDDLPPLTSSQIVLELETRCRGQGIDLVALSEALVPGYPFWIDSVRAAKHGVPMQMDLQAHTHREAVRIKGARSNTASQKTPSH